MYICVNDYISYVEMRRKPNKTKDKKKKTEQNQKPMKILAEPKFNPCM